MIIKQEINDLSHFEAWSGAARIKNKLLAAGIDEDFIEYAESVLGEEITEGVLNDFLWFEAAEIFDHFGLDENGDPKSEDEENY